jgi:hypothetical protein
VSVALVTVAVNVCVFPSSTELLAGVTVTLMDDGGGGGGGAAAELAPPPPQPVVHALAARRASVAPAAVLAFCAKAVANFIPPSVERGRMPRQLQAKGQRRKP